MAIFQDNKCTTKAQPGDEFQTKKGFICYTWFFFFAFLSKEIAFYRERVFNKGISVLCRDNAGEKRSFQMIEYKIPNKKKESQKHNIDNADSLGLLLSLFHP